MSETENTEIPPGGPYPVSIEFGADMEKTILNSKKAGIAIGAIFALTLIALMGKGDPTLYGAISLIAGAAIGAQGAADYKNQ